MRANPQDLEAASKPKAKKGYIDKDYHGFFSLNGVFVKFSTYGGRRYVNLLDVVDEKYLTTIGGMQ
jgi:hypothetical protein